MDYNAPFGSADPNAGYVDRNTPAGQAGSRVPALAIEMPQREIVTVIKNAGLVPNKTDPTQLYQAIEQRILAATGGGGDENYVLMTEARVRLPIYPEGLSADGRIPVFAPGAGQVRLPAGYEFLHRGIFLVTTEQIDFATTANKTYHLRWSPSEGFALRDLANAAYNPAALAESNPVFDSGYDDVLWAKVTTNASNIANVVNLANKSSFRRTDRLEFLFIGASLDWVELANSGVELNWARTPVAFPSLSHVSSGGTTSSPPSDSLRLMGVRPNAPVTRYALPNVGTREYDDLGSGGTLHFNWSAFA
jgi:hypothetical protein